MNVLPNGGAPWTVGMKIRVPMKHPENPWCDHVAVVTPLPLEPLIFRSLELCWWIRVNAFIITRINDGATKQQQKDEHEQDSEKTVENC